MWIAKNNDLIILAKNTKKELQNSLCLMVYTSIESTEEDYILYNGEYLTQAEIEAKRQAQFHKEFFNTSLGYIRRTVSMKDGSKKSFLGELLMPIKAGLELGQQVTIITYIEPDFTEDVTDWEQYQELKQATPQFIQECLNQIVIDFQGIEA